MPELAILVLKALLAGGMVVAFSLLSEALQPKMFAGLFAGAPVVASVSLAITALVKPASVQPAVLGMAAGACGMVACCAAAALVTSRFNTVLGSGASWVVWAVVAFGLYLVFLA